PFVLPGRDHSQSNLVGSLPVSFPLRGDRLARRLRRKDRMRAPRPITILIAALGGEGGGVLTDWIVRAASLAGFPVQSTSIPGVAQRTGATTYYIEIFPVKAAKLD